MNSEKRIQLSIGFLLLIIIIGTIGYYFVEGWDILDCFYMTLITVSTIGYGEVHQLSYFGRVFTSVLIVVGVGSMGYTIGSVTQALMEGQLRRILGNIKMEKEIQKLTNHYIVCGYGRVGRQVSQEFKLRNNKVVVIESVIENAALARREGFYTVQDDATTDEALLHAGIKNARGLVGAVGSDAENVFICLTAKELNPQLIVVVRAESSSAEKKLRRAGADRVISPYLSCGKKMALAAIRPNIVEFMEISTLDAQTGYRIEEIIVKSDSLLVNKTLRETNIRQQTGVMIIGLKKANANLIFNPPADMPIEKDDILVAVGDQMQLKKLETITETPQ